MRSMDVCAIKCVVVLHCDRCVTPEVYLYWIHDELDRMVANTINTPTCLLGKWPYLTGWLNTIPPNIPMHARGLE